MSDPPRASELDASLLSIDVDRELAKILERRFRSPQQYVVELVRAACARGASRIEVTLRRDSVQIVDDGAPLSRAQAEPLVVLLDGTRPSERRQAALASLEDDPGSGLLATLACAPERFRLSSGDGRSGLLLDVQHGRARLEDQVARGTQVLLRRHGEPRRERGLLGEAAAHAPVELLVDGTLISRRALEGLAWSPLALEGEGSSASLAIPLHDDLCHATRLWHGVRVDEQVRAASTGFVFELVFEAGGPWPADLWQRGASLAEHLYQDLVQRYAQLSPEHQDRVDALLFLLHRRQPEHPLFVAYAPFAVLGQTRRWTLAQVQAGVAEGSLTALVEGSEAKRFDTRGQVLWLSQRQREFLVEQRRLPLAAPMAAPRPAAGWRRSLWWLTRGWRALREGHARPVRQRVDTSSLRADERGLVAALQSALDQGRWSVPGCQGEVQVVVSDGRSRLPVRVAAADVAMAGSVLILYRQHLLTGRAARAVALDPENLRLALAALLDGADRWLDPRH